MVIQKLVQKLFIVGIYLYGFALVMPLDAALPRMPRTRMLRTKAMEEAMVPLFAPRGTSVDMTNQAGMTLLMAAARLGEVETVKMLCETRSSLINKPDNSGATAAHYAAEAGRSQVLEVLQACQADLSVKDNRGRAPIVSAVLGGNIEAVDTLHRLVGNSILEQTDDAGCTLMSTAVVGKQAAMVKHLHEKYHLSVIQKIPDGKSGVPLIIGAITAKDLAMVKTLIEAGVDAYQVYQDLTLLGLAKKMKHKPLINYFQSLEHKREEKQEIPDLNRQPLVQAAGKNELALVDKEKPDQEEDFEDVIKKIGSTSKKKKKKGTPEGLAQYQREQERAAAKRQRAEDREKKKKLEDEERRRVEEERQQKEQIERQKRVVAKQQKESDYDAELAAYLAQQKKKEEHIKSLYAELQVKRGDEQQEKSDYEEELRKYFAARALMAQNINVGQNALPAINQALGKSSSFSPLAQIFVPGNVVPVPRGGRYEENELINMGQALIQIATVHRTKAGLKNSVTGLKVHHNSVPKGVNIISPVATKKS